MKRPRPGPTFCRPATAEGARLAHQLSSSSEPYLPQRRTVAALELVAMAAMAAALLDQLGLDAPGFGSRPHPGHRFNTAAVVRSPRAYWILKTPDAALGLTSYALTLTLATMGGARRWQRTPGVPVMLTLKLLLDAGVGAWLTREEVLTGQGLCWPCLIASGAAAVALPVGIPEGLAGCRAWLGRRHRAPLVPGDSPHPG